MIEKMQMVYVVSSVSRKDEMLEGLRNLGLLHLAEKKSPARAATERFTTLSKTATELLDYAPDKKSKNKNSAPVLSDKEFEEMYQGVLNALDKKSTLVQDISAANAEIERIKAWGEFSPAELKQLKEAGYDLHFYRLGKREYEMAVQDENVQMVRLASIDKMDTVAVIGSLPATIPAAEFAIPEKGIDELTKEIEDSQKQIAECDEVFKKAAVYESSLSLIHISGGGMAYAFRAFGDRIAFISGWAAFGAFITIIPWEAIYVVDILSIVFPILKAGIPL